MSRILHKNRIFTVKELDFKVRKKKVKAYMVLEPNTVAILPITRKGYILLEEQYRPPIGKRIYEIPAGHIEKNERPLHSAKRELEEETGFKARRLKFLIYFYPSPGLVSKKEYLYLAEGLTKGRLALDKDEDITIKEISINDALKFIKSGKIVDAKTIIGILYYKRFINRS